MGEQRVRCAAVLAMLVLLLAVSAGCMGFHYFPARDIVVLKLSENGTQEWASTIDGGQDDAGEDMAELENGELVIVGQNGTSRRMAESPRAILLSPNGKVIADRTNSGSFDWPRAVVAGSDGGFAVLMRGGELTRFDHAGTAIWTLSTAMPEVRSLTRLDDGGYLVGGGAEYIASARAPPVTEGITAQSPAVTAGVGSGSPSVSERALPSYTPSMYVKRAQATKYLSNGERAWQRTFDEGIGVVYAALEDVDDGSLLFAGSVPDRSSGRDRTLELVAQRTDRDGTTGPMIGLGKVESPEGIIRIRTSSGGTEVLYSTWSSGIQYPEFGVASALIDPAGTVTWERTLKASRVFNGTSDGGYISVGVPVARGVESYDSSLSPGPHPYTTFHTLRSDAEGHLVWNHPLSIGSIREVKRVIETADGGYAILAMTEKG